MPGSRLALSNPIFWAGVATWVALLSVFSWLALRETDPLKYLALFALLLVAGLIAVTVRNFLRVRISIRGDSMTIHGRADDFTIHRSVIDGAWTTRASDGAIMLLMPAMSEFLWCVEIGLADGRVEHLDEVVGTRRSTQRLATAIEQWASLPASRSGGVDTRTAPPQP